MAGAALVAGVVGAAISSWTVAFDLPPGLTLGSYRDATLTASGQHVTAKNREYDGTVALGASATFGFLVGGGSGTPTNGTVNGASCAGGGGGGDMTPPSTPTGLHPTGTTAGSVSLAWNASTDNVGVTGYDVFVNGAASTTVTGTSATVGGLAASTTSSFSFAKQHHLGELAFWEVTQDRNACTGALFQCTNVPQAPTNSARSSPATPADRRVGPATSAASPWYRRDPLQATANGT